MNLIHLWILLTSAAGMSYGVRGLSLALHPKTPYDVQISRTRRTYALAAIIGSFVLGMSVLL